MFKLLKTDGTARLGEFTTARGVIKTPVFMNVATAAAIKGGLSSFDLDKIGCQVALCNTYHLHLRPQSGDNKSGDEVVKSLGGLHKFMNWQKPILTDSGGFQVFSLAKLRKIKEEGVYFSSHIDGRKIFMGPEESMQIQSNLGSDIAMAFDECVENPSRIEICDNIEMNSILSPPANAVRAAKRHDGNMKSYCHKQYAKNSAEMTVRWLKRCVAELSRLNERENTNQLLFGINQGSIYEDIRIENMKQIVGTNELAANAGLTGYAIAGYAIGGLAVGESAEEMYRIVETVEPYMPTDKPRYLMGVGTPQNLVETVERGIDFFDCVLPSRNARHGTLFTSTGQLNMLNEKHALSDIAIDENCDCETCRSHSRAYVRHLFKANEMLAMRLSVIHNLYYYNNLMTRIRESIERGTFAALKREILNVYA